MRYVVNRLAYFYTNFIFVHIVDPCPAQLPNPPKLRYPGNCQRFIDCQNK